MKIKAKGLSRLRPSPYFFVNFYINFFKTNSYSRINTAMRLNIKESFFLSFSFFIIFVYLAKKYPIRAVK